MLECLIFLKDCVNICKRDIGLGAGSDKQCKISFIPDRASSPSRKTRTRCWQGMMGGTAVRAPARMASFINVAKSQISRASTQRPPACRPRPSL